MHIVETPIEIVESSGSHYQLFLFGRPPMVRWRLLSGNNRDMCHGVNHSPDVEDCIDTIRSFIEFLPAAQPLIKRDDKGDWTWLLIDRGVPVAEAGHSYDRKIRCSRALAKVLQDAPAAPIRPQLVISDHRRWPGSRFVAQAAADRPARRQLS